MVTLVATYLLVHLDNLDDIIINFPPEKLLCLAAIVDRMKKHQLNTELPQPDNTQRKSVTRVTVGSQV